MLTRQGDTGHTQTRTLQEDWMGELLSQLKHTDNRGAASEDCLLLCILSFEY